LPRIPLPSPSELSPEQRRVYDAVVNGPRGALRGPLRAALHNAELADKWQQLGELLRYRTSLAPRLSELAILVTARHFDCQFEWYAHEPPARQAGLNPDAIEAIRRGERPAFASEDEQAIFDYALQLHEKHFLAEATYQRALQVIGVLGVVELTALLGYYAMVAMTLNAHELTPPADTPRPLPPRGEA
jgi:4-carboxymuconolactone decarboxylase